MGHLWRQILELKRIIPIPKYTLQWKRKSNTIQTLSISWRRQNFKQMNTSIWNYKNLNNTFRFICRPIHSRIFPFLPWTSKKTLSLSLSIYIYIYIYICVCVCVCVWWVRENRNISIAAVSFIFPRSSDDYESFPLNCKRSLSTVCISHSTNTLGKGMNPIILPPAMGK